MHRVLAAALAVVVVGVPLSAEQSSDYILSSDPFLVRFPEGNEALARRALGILREAMDEFGHRLETEGDPIRVVLADDAWTFRRYAGAYARADVGGIARSGEGLIVVKTPRLLMNGDFRGILRHELVHVLLARSTDTSELPRWLNEGLAMMLSNEHRWASAWNVGWMYHQGRLITLRDLDWVLMEPGVEMDFNDAYAQSLSMTRHLHDTVGDDALFAIVLGVRTMSFGDAMRAHAGMGPVEFYEDWVGSLWAVALVFWLVSGFSVFQVMAFMTVAAWWHKRRQGRRILQRWDEEDAAPAYAGLPTAWNARYGDEAAGEYAYDDDELDDPTLAALDEYEVFEEPYGPDDDDEDEWDAPGPGRFH
jgi:hypothetical protein